MKVIFYYFTSENNIKQQESLILDYSIENIYSLEAPYIYFLQKETKNQTKTDSYQIAKELLIDFKNINKDLLNNKEMIKSIMEFGFNLCINNMEEAYKSVKSIQDPTIWENMAQMCVRSKRLDVAEICIGKMRFGRGSKSIRESKKEKEQECQMAMVAIQLNMKKEAEDLYKQVGRWDLLNQMY